MDKETVLGHLSTTYSQHWQYLPSANTMKSRIKVLQTAIPSGPFSYSALISSLGAYSDATINAYVQTVNTALSFCTVNPPKPPRPRPTTSADLPESFKPSVDAVIRELPVEDPFRHCLELLRITGLRLGELWQLRATGKTSYELTESKTGRTRKLSFSEGLSERVARGVEASTKISRAAFEKRWYRHPVLRKFKAHYFRHSLITSLLDSGAPLAQVQSLIGHQSPLTTSKYYTSNSEKEASLYEQAYGETANI